MSSRNIQYLRREQIDVNKWDRCIRAAPNGLIYAFSYYLDHVADNWDALVRGDYHQIMPVAWKKKWGIRYIYTPPFIQRLGIFGEAVSLNDASAFYTELSRHFSYVDADMNEPSRLSQWSSLERTNFFIRLHDPYKLIRQQYTNECIKNIGKSIRHGCALTENIDIGQVVDLYKKAYGDIAAYKVADYERLLKLAQYAYGLKQLTAYGIINKNEELMFGALLFHCDRRIYYILGAPDQKGRKARAAYFFVDSIISMHAQSQMIFDFEGSDIPSVAAFYSRFGPEVERYYHLHKNNLPWWIRWVKN